MKIHILFHLSLPRSEIETTFLLSAVNFAVRMASMAFKYFTQFVILYVSICKEDFTMSKRGENIYKRKDNRWEARYIQSYRPDGTAKYGYWYG